jgi:hypothetical protein
MKWIIESCDNVSRILLLRNASYLKQGHQDSKNNVHVWSGGQSLWLYQMGQGGRVKVQHEGVAKLHKWS